ESSHSSPLRQLRTSSTVSARVTRYCSYTWVTISGIVSRPVVSVASGDAELTHTKASSKRDAGSKQDAVAGFGRIGMTLVLVSTDVSVLASTGGSSGAIARAMAAGFAACCLIS